MTAIVTQIYKLSGLETRPRDLLSLVAANCPSIGQCTEDAQSCPSRYNCEHEIETDRGPHELCRGFHIHGQSRSH